MHRASVLQAHALSVILLLAGCGASEDNEQSGSGQASTGQGGAGQSSSGQGGSGQSSSGQGGAGQGGSGGAWMPPPACPMCAAAAPGGTTSSAELNEISGVVASAVHPDVFYVHNDSGDSPRFFAIDKAGNVLGIFPVMGAGAIDWEDMARGPCEGSNPASGSCLYFGDVGDNPGTRTSYTVYRVKEPADPAAGQQVPGDALPFNYPDGSHNCETLLIHPVTGVLTVVTKVGSGDSGVYEFPMPLVPGQMATLAKIGNRSVPQGNVQITGGDVHPQAKAILLRTYSHLFYLPMGLAQSVGEALLGTPCVVPSAAEGQGEAVAFLASGAGYLTVSEGQNVPLNLFDCSDL